MKIGIIGNGVLGNCLHRYYDFSKEVKVYDKDPFKSYNTLDEVLGSEIIFICLLLEDNAFSIEAYDILAGYVGKMRAGTMCVIRTTVIPGTCINLQTDYSEIKIVHIPEFLTEKNAYSDFLKPEISVIGALDHNETTDILRSILPKAEKHFKVTLTQAEWIKHAIAGYLSLKVSFFNQLYDSLNGDFEAVREAITADPRIGVSHSNVFQDGYRGWGGKCFSKDTPLFSEISDMTIMEEVCDYNDRLLRGQKEKE